MLPKESLCCFLKGPTIYFSPLFFVGLFVCFFFFAVFTVLRGVNINIAHRLDSIKAILKTALLSHCLQSPPDSLR